MAKLIAEVHKHIHLLSLRLLPILLDVAVMRNNLPKILFRQWQSITALDCLKYYISNPEMSAQMSQ